jgi:hypothetical protein
MLTYDSCKRMEGRPDWDAFIGRQYPARHRNNPQEATMGTSDDSFRAEGLGLFGFLTDSDDDNVPVKAFGSVGYALNVGVRAHDDGRTVVIGGEAEVDERVASPAGVVDDPNRS